MEKKETHGQSPNSLELPVPKGGQSKKIFHLIIAVLGFMAFIVLWSFMDSGEDEKKKQEENTAREAVESRGLLPGEEVGRGLAASFPKPPERNAGMLPPPQAADNKKDQIKYVGPPAVDRGDEARRLEEQEERRRKKEAYQAGLGSGIMIRRNDQNSARQTSASPENASGNAAAVNMPMQADSYDPAADRDKEAFFERADTSQWMSPYTREAGHQFEMKTGTVIPGLMVTGINSDLPGNIIAQVSQNVYDTATGKFLLIPQGSKIYGAYDSRVVYGQERVLVAWNRIIFPDGSSVTLGAMPGADMAGYAGFNDEVDNHYFRIFGSAVLMSLITGGMSYAMDKVDNNSSGNDDKTSMQDEMASALAAQMGQTSMKMLEKNLSLKPTLGIRPGYRFNIVVTKDVIFRGPYKPE